MSDYIEETDGVPSENVAGDSTEQKPARSPRGRKPRTAASADGAKRKITIRKRTKVTVRKSEEESSEPAEQVEMPFIEVAENIPEPIQEESAEGAVPADEAVAAAEAPAEAQPATEEVESRPQPGERGERDFRNHRDKRMKNGKNRRVMEELPPEVRLETVRALAVSELYEGMEFFRACGTINQGFEGCNFTFSDKVLRSFISTVDAADDGFYLRLKAKGEQLNDLCVEFAADSSGNGVRAFDRQGDERQDCLLEPESLAFGDIHRITDDLNGNPAPSGKAPVLTEVARHEIKSGNSQI